ncbi:unnamed protein product [Lymnaea stagnalis]|uniref:Uncharacterized protein n=1 Tax=Lymnaea stagnalis TaxID=6523 RepID=A0AAV2IM46_LYMST
MRFFHSTPSQEHVYQKHFTNPSILPTLTSYDTLCLSITLRELDTFGSCLMHIDSCDSGKEEVVKTINDEKIRLKMPECETPSLNQGVRISVAIHLVSLLATLVTMGSMS